MRITAWIVALTCLAIGPAWAQDCTLKKLADLSLTVQSDDTFLPVRIGDEIEQFGLDMDGSLGGISETFVKAHGFKTLPMTDAVTVRVGGTVIKSQAVVPELTIGSIPIKDMHFLLLPTEMPSKDDNAPPKNGIGYLSIARFDKLDIELDLNHNGLRLFLPDHCPGQVVYWTSPEKTTAMPYLKSEVTSSIRSDMTLDGKDVRVAFTLSSVSTISMDAAHYLFGLTADSPGMVATDPPHEFSSKPGQKFYNYRFKSLTAGGINIANPNILIYDMPNFCSTYHKDRNDAQVAGPPSSTLLPVKNTGNCDGAFDITVGRSVLTKLRLYFSAKDKLIYATAADAQN